MNKERNTLGSFNYYRTQLYQYSGFTSSFDVTGQEVVGPSAIAHPRKKKVYLSKLLATPSPIYPR